MDLVSTIKNIHRFDGYCSRDEIQLNQRLQHLNREQEIL